MHLPTKFEQSVVKLGFTFNFDLYFPFRLKKILPKDEQKYTKIVTALCTIDFLFNFQNR